MFSEYFQKSGPFKAIQLTDDVQAFLTAFNKGDEIDGFTYPNPYMAATDGTHVFIFEEGVHRRQLLPGRWIVVHNRKVFEICDDEWFQKQFVAVDRVPAVVESTATS